MRNSVIFAALLAVVLLAACGGKHNSNPGNNDDTTGLDVQLSQSGNAKVASAAGDGLGGINVELISQGNGAVVARGTTDNGGHFRFLSTPSGKFMLRVRFKAGSDLDGDGQPDDVDMLFPVELLQNVVAQLIETLQLDDTDADSLLDSLKVEVRITGSGQDRHEVQLHRHRHDDVQVDDNGDGTVDDTFQDEDHNGLPEDRPFHGARGPKLRGTIEALSASSITVAGQQFTITDATVFRVRGDQNGTASQFAVGDQVQLTSFTDDNGQQVALEIRLKHGHGANHDNDDRSEQTFRGTIQAIGDGTLNLSGLELTLGDRTHFFDLNGVPAVQSGFAVGDYVEVEVTKLADGTLLVRRIQEQTADDPTETCLELVGTISNFTSSGATINGLNLSINTDTKFTLSGDVAGTSTDFSNGQFVQVCANFVDGQWVASEFEQDVEGFGGGHDGGGDDNGGNHDGGDDGGQHGGHS